MTELIEKKGASWGILRIVRYITFFLMVFGVIMVIFGTYDHDRTRIIAGLVCAPLGLLATWAIDLKSKSRTR